MCSTGEETGSDTRRNASSVHGVSIQEVSADGASIHGPLSDAAVVDRAPVDGALEDGALVDRALEDGALEDRKTVSAMPLGSSFAQASDRVHVRSEGTIIASE
jgi:hypothetical protein